MNAEEIICEFMEPRPDHRPSTTQRPLHWWSWRGLCRYHTNCAGHPEPFGPLTLDRLHEVEAQLTEEQWRHYALLMFHECCREAKTLNPIEDLLTKNRRALIHATVPQKIKALAGVLTSAAAEESDSKPPQSGQ